MELLNKRLEAVERRLIELENELLTTRRDLDYVEDRVRDMDSVPYDIFSTYNNADE